MNLEIKEEKSSNCLIAWEIIQKQGILDLVPCLHTKKLKENLVIVLKGQNVIKHLNFLDWDIYFGRITAN